MSFYSLYLQIFAEGSLYLQILSKCSLEVCDSVWTVLMDKQESQIGTNNK